MVPPCSVRISRVPTYSISLLISFRIRGYHPLWRNFPEPSTNYTNSLRANPRSLAATRGISIDFFSSGYLDVSVPRVRLLWLCIHHKIPALQQVGFPIQRSAGQRLFATSPQLIASYYVFHRLQMPRHPPCTLSHLTI